jgi:hypothetical protein
LFFNSLICENVTGGNKEDVKTSVRKGGVETKILWIRSRIGDFYTYKFVSRSFACNVCKNEINRNIFIWILRYIVTGILFTAEACGAVNCTSTNSLLYQKYVERITTNICLLFIMHADNCILRIFLTTEKKKELYNLSKLQVKTKKILYLNEIL